MSEAPVETILVTGANGFVGGYLLEALSRHYPGRRIVGTGLGPQGEGPIVHLDITDAEAVRRLIGRLRPDICVHLAAVASVDQSFQQARTVWDVNLCGTLNVAEAVCDIVPACRLIFASSGEVYGLSFANGEPVDEQTVLAPANPYATAKAAADLALGEMALRGLRVIRLRLFNHTGPGQTEQYVLPRFAAQVARIAEGLQEPIIHTGALDRWRDFLDVRDVVEAYLAAMRAAEDGFCVNICSGIARRVGDILIELMEVVQVRAEVIERVSGVRRIDVRSAVGSPQRAAMLLDWRPRIAWTETLRSLLAYWRQQAAGSR
jgi:GDP-4-dehydro-6-deoxy-D-mannose reductase